MANQKHQGQTGSEVDPLILLAGAVLGWVFVYLFWERFHTAIATAYSWVRIVEFAPFVVMQSVWAIVLGLVFLIAGVALWLMKSKHSKYGIWMVVMGAFLCLGYFTSALFSSWWTFLKESDKNLLEWKHLKKSSVYANLFAIVVCVIPFAVWVVRRSLATNLTNHKHFGKEKDYSLHSFTDRMAVHYPHLELFRKINLTERPINSGKYRMADTEKQFAIKHDLLDRVKGNEYKINRARAAHVFSDQMTKLWTSFTAMTRWEQAVIAVLLPRIAATDPDMSDQNYKEALACTNSLLRGYWRDAAASYDGESDTIKLDLTLARATIKKYGKSPKVLRYFKAHAYIGTILYAMLVDARTLGVLQPAELRWLRVVDRRLWLIIDNVGKIVAWTEVGAIYSHYLHELKQKRGIEKPQVEGAVRGLIEGVESYEFSAEEIQDINARMKQKEAAQHIDLEATTKPRDTVIVMVHSVGTGKKKSLFEAAVLAQNGDILFHQRCKPDCAIDISSRNRLQLSDEDLEAAKSLPTADVVRDKLFFVVFGQSVVTFDKSDFDVVAGIERSAASISECKGTGEFDMVATAVLEGAVDEQEIQPIVDTVAAAKMCHAIWVCQQKEALKSQTEGGPNRD